jgi:hypothetical protein
VGEREVNRYDNALAPLPLLIDSTIFGSADRFVTRLPREAVRRLKVGDYVAIYDDDVAPRLFRVEEVLEDGREARFALAA